MTRYGKESYHYPNMGGKEIHDMKLTKDQKIKYVKNGGSKCPYCGSSDIEGVRHPQVDGPGASQEVHCRNCGKGWHDLYVLDDVTEAVV